MLPPAQDIHRRRPVWAALSDLFLDTDLAESDLRRIARALLESNYTDQELADILYGEVFPVCIGNLRSAAGEWTAIDTDWLQQRVLANEPKFWKKWRWSQFHRGMIKHDWKKVMAAVHEPRRK